MAFRLSLSAIGTVQVGRSMICVQLRHGRRCTFNAKFTVRELEYGRGDASQNEDGVPASRRDEDAVRGIGLGLKSVARQRGMSNRLYTLCRADSAAICGGNAVLH